MTRPSTASSSRALLAAQGWCAPEVVEALDEGPVERALLLARLRELGVGDDRLAQLDDLLRLQARLPGLELTRLLVDAPSPAPRWYLGRLRGAAGAGPEAMIQIAPWSDPAQLRRFQREAKPLGALRHPLVAGMLDAGEHNGLCWVAVERVAGRPLSALLADGPLAEVRALAITRRFAVALSALGLAGVLHRGVAPEALVVPDEDDAARLVDAGLLRGLCGLRRQAELDRPDYVAPEQVRAQAVDERTLVYNLGAILFHLLAGAPPFAASSAELTRKAHLFEAVPDLTCLLPDLSEATARIVATALRKASGERQRGLETFAAACAAALTALGAPPSDALPVSAEPAAPADIVPVPVPVPVADPTPATAAVALIDDPFAAADAALEAASSAQAPADAELSSRILAKHAALKAERTLAPSPRRRAVVTESFLARSAPPARVDVVMGAIIANGWVDAEGQRALRDFFRVHASSLALRMRGGVSQLLVTRGIISAQQGRELELTLADQAPFPHYRLGRLLGAGALGRVYAALDIAGGAEVAFKIFRVADPALRGRFIDQHASIARLSHPGVAQALACGADGADGDACFAASRLVPGTTLAALLGSQRVAPEAWALRVALQVAEALAYVHARTGQAHLGLSLGNVLLQREADETRLFPPGERALVADFGLAALADARRGEAALTAPERLRGEPGDARSDIFALGALLHRLLAGRAPTAREILEGADPGRLTPGLHPLTRETVATALSADPARRHADHDVLVATLAQVAREVADTYAHEPQIVRERAPAPAQPVSTRVLRRHTASGPAGAAPARGGHPGARREAPRPSGDGDHPPG